MNTPIVTGISVLVSVSLVGCCALNAGIDGHAEFESNRNAALGKKLDLSFVHPSQWRTEMVDSKTTVYKFGEPGKCQYDYVLSVETGKVLSWRYVSEPGMCSSTRYYCGPW